MSKYYEQHLAYIMYTYYMHNMITKQDDLLGTLIHDVAHLLRLDIDRRLVDHNLTRVKWLALGILQKRGALTQSELSERLELGAASVGRLVDRLVERGFVTREQDPEDRRSYRLVLTNSATSLLDELEGTSVSLREDTLHSLTKSEISTLNSGLLKLKANLKSRASALVAITGLTVFKTANYSDALTTMASAI